MKRCPGCGEQDLSRFGKNKRRPDGLQVYCKTCKKSLDAKYYGENKQAQFDRNTDNRNELRLVVAEIKIHLGCKYCPENDPCCLDFHHREGEEKETEVARLITQGSRKKLFEEIKKCDVVCRNCHAKLHAGRLLPL